MASDKTKQLVLDMLRKGAEPLTAAEISDKIGGDCDKYQATQYLYSLFAEGVAAFGPRKVCRVSLRTSTSWVACAKEGQADLFEAFKEEGRS